MRKVNLYKVNEYFADPSNAPESVKLVEKLVDDYLHSETPKSQTEILLADLEMLNEEI